MRILVINPPNVPFSSEGILIEPIDTLGVASYIAALGHDVRLLDMDINKIRPEKFPEHIEDEHYDVAVIIYDYHIPLHCDGTLQAVKDIASHLKSKRTKVIVGGKKATYKPQELLFENSPIDILIRHEAEPALESLLELDSWTSQNLASVPSISYLDNDQQITNTEKPKKAFDLNRLPISNRSLIDIDSYIDVRTILSSRGCHMKCDFCHVPGFWGNWRGRSAEAIVDEIEYLVNECGTKKILFLDDNATVHRKRVKEICRQLIERNVKVALGCLGSMDLFDTEMMELMYKAGFRWIHYGVESGSDRLLKTIHKKVVANDVRRIIGQTREIGFRVRTSWIMDLPTSTEDELKQTADLILELRTEEIRLHHLAIRMGSSIYEDYADIPSTQYIHQGVQNQNLCAVAPEKVSQVVNEIADELGDNTHAIVRKPDEFIDISALTERSKNLNIVSLCPLRYGLGWAY